MIMRKRFLALTAASLVLGLCYGDLTKSLCGNKVMSDIVDEVFAVITTCGYRTYWPTADAYKKELFENLIPTTYAHVSSTLQDIHHKHPTEIDILRHLRYPDRTHGLPPKLNLLLKFVKKLRKQGVTSRFRPLLRIILHKQKIYPVLS